jgi:hypothetical protein
LVLVLLLHTMMLHVRHRRGLLLRRRQMTLVERRMVRGMLLIGVLLLVVAVEPRLVNPVHSDGSARDRWRRCAVWRVPPLHR